MFKQLRKLFPKSILWRLTFLNVAIIAATIALSSWALYNTACFLVEGISDIENERQTQFNTTLFQYLLLFSIIGIIVGSLIHFHLIKKVIQPIRRLTESTKQLQQGYYPEPIETSSQDEMGKLTEQYNGLIQQLKANEEHREQLVNDLSHEIRTPLANLNGYLQALESGVVEGDKELYQSLHAESKRMTYMVEQLDTLKQWDHITLQTITQQNVVQISEQIKQSVTMFKWALVKENIKLDTEIESADVQINIEGFQQVMRNLIDNAIQYYEGPGHIFIEGKQLSGMYRISVQGPSTPISASEADRMFERFYRIDASRSRQTGGSGLGLAISQTIINNHNGEIGHEVNSGMNTFWFTLPLT